MFPDAETTDLGNAFTVGEARRAGWTETRLYARELERPFHGIRAIPAFDPVGLSPDETHLRLLEAYAAGMHDEEFFSRISAAVAWGIPLPRDTVTNDIDVCVWKPRRSPRGRGVRGHAVPRHLATALVHPAHGFRVSSPASTWAMLASVLAHPYDLIAAGDAFIRSPQHPDDPPALATLAQLGSAVAAGRRIGIAALREALLRVRPGAASRPETWTRLTLVDAGFPEPVLAFEVVGDDGRLVARVDMAYPELKVAIEYEGEHHLLDGRQWTKDIGRYERLAAEGWIVIRVTKDELFKNPDSLVVRVRRAVARAAGVV